MLTMKDIVREGHPSLKKIAAEVDMPINDDEKQLLKDMLQFLKNSQDEEIAKKYDKPVFIHCGHPPFSLPWQIGLLAERHPQVQVVMIHMGHGHGVYIDGSITMAKKFDNLMLECSGMPMGCQIKNAYETVGSERVMFGIDSPFHHPTVEIQRVLSCGLNDSQLEDVFYNNAAKFMGIKA